VGVGLSRLGVEASLLTTFGDDDRAVFIKRRLLEENVDLSMAKTAIRANSNLSAIIVYLGERTILTYHADVEDQIENIPVTEYIYLTSSSGRSSEKMFLKVLELSDVKIAFNPNKKDINGDELFTNLLKKTEILFVNFEEGKLIVGDLEEGVERVEQVKKMIDKILSLGVKVVVITDGVNGAYLGVGDRKLFCSVSNFERIEATGAGDSFASGFLGKYLVDQNYEEALRFGMANSGSVVSKTGSWEGLLKKDEIERVILEHSEIVVSEI
jgi:sugar/nucleoside kinase (ribokinase family)